MYERPSREGLYDPRFEHDACGVGFVADLKNVRSHEIVRKAIAAPAARRRRRATARGSWCSCPTPSS
jgi:glutamate synthase domain-containing protein 1